MAVILLSIRDEFLALMKARKKTWEYRKTIPRENISHIVFYNVDTKQITDAAAVGENRVAAPAAIVQQTGHQSGVSAKGLLGYLQGKDEVVAFQIDHMMGPLTAIDREQLKKWEANFRAPQGFRYLFSSCPLSQKIGQHIPEIRSFL